MEHSLLVGSFTPASAVLLFLFFCMAVGTVKGQGEGGNQPPLQVLAKIQAKSSPSQVILLFLLTYPPDDHTFTTALLLTTQPPTS